MDDLTEKYKKVKQDQKSARQPEMRFEFLDRPKQQFESPAEISDKVVQLSGKSGLLSELGAREATDAEFFLMLRNPENYARYVGKAVWLRNNTYIEPHDFNEINDEGEARPVSKTKFDTLARERRIKATEEAKSGTYEKFIIHVKEDWLELDVVGGRDLTTTASVGFVKKEKPALSTGMARR